MGRILLIEDNPSLRAAWAAELRARGDQVVAVGRDGAAAARDGGGFALVLDGAVATAVASLAANAARLGAELPRLAEAVRARARQSGRARELDAILPPAGAEGARHAAFAAYLALLGDADGDVPRPIALPALLARVAAVAAGAVAADVALRADYAPAPEVRAGARALAQVFLSLVVNAAQAGARAITLRTGTADDGAALVEVADDGRGIDPALLPHIFTPYFSTKRGDGLGLGLWLARETVRGLGGELAVESAPGRGSRFCVRLPPVAA